MGIPKQLLPYQDDNLLQHAVNTALGTGFSPVIVVLGAKANDILPVIKNDNIIIVQNEEWEEGFSKNSAIPRCRVYPRSSAFVGCCGCASFEARPSASRLIGDAVRARTSG